MLTEQTLAPATRGAAFPRYQVTPVAPGGSTAAAINDAGYVVGSFQDPNSVAQFGFVFAGYFVNLGPADGSSAATAINNSGVVVGHASGSPQNFGIVFDDRPGGSMETFNPFGGFNSTGTGVNDAGQICGWGDDLTSNHSFVQTDGQVTDLGSLGGTFSEANAINNNGAVAGASTLADESITHAYLYANGTISDLGTLGGNFSWATGINDSSQVVGYSAFDPLSTDLHAFLYADGVIRDLGTLNGGQSEALGINNAGQVVGLSYGSLFEDRHAFIYADGTMVDLNSLIDPASGWTILDAQDINNNGQIAANATKDGVEFAVRLDPA